MPATSTSSKSFSELCELQKASLNELWTLKAQLFGQWHNPTEIEAVRRVEQAFGARAAGAVLDTLFWSSQKSICHQPPEVIFIRAVHEFFGQGIAEAVTDALDLNLVPISPDVLGKIALARNRAVIQITAATVLGLREGVSISHRPFPVKTSKNKEDPIRGIAEEYGGLVANVEDAIPHDRVLMQFSGKGWTRYFTFTNTERAQQAIATMALTTGQAVFGNLVKG